MHPLPMLKADADPLGLVRRLQHSVPTEMAVDAGPGGLGLVGETLHGRSPLSRFAACCAHHAPARLVGQACPPPACPEDPVGRVRARLAACGPLRLLPACAVRAGTRLDVARRDGPVATTSRSGWGA